jgi:hypothetical protein
MRQVVKITDNKYLNIYEVYDKDTHCNGYQYAERRGIDSVAFICYDIDSKKFLLNREFTPPTGEFMTRAFGGSIDKVKGHIDIVIDEVHEEAGYKVDSCDIFRLGSCFVSTQMNQNCYLYLVIVCDKKKIGRKPENQIEKMASIVSLTPEEIIRNNDWKAITILAKAKDIQIYGEKIC